MGKNSLELVDRALQGVDSSGKEGQGIYAARVVHLGLDLGTSGSVAARTLTAEALGGDARRRAVSYGLYGPRPSPF